MKFTEFFKLYFEVTNRQYSDKIIWNTKSDNYKKATEKGQNPRISKLERRLFIILQYLELIFTVAYSIITNVWIVSFFGVIAFILSVFITNFSFVIILKLYLSLNNSIYSQIWLQMFYGNFDFSYLTKSKINGYFPTRKLYFQLPSKLVATCKDKNTKISISFTTQKAKIIINNEKITINSEQNNIYSLLEEIANVINKTSQPYACYP